MIRSVAREWAGKDVRNEVDLPFGGLRVRRPSNIEARRCIVPAVRHEDQIPLDPVRAHPQEVGADAERVPDRGAAARGEHRDEVLDVRQVFSVDLPERNRYPNGLGECDEAEEGPVGGRILKDPEDGGPRDLDLLPLGSPALGVGERCEHAL